MFVLYTKHERILKKQENFVTVSHALQARLFLTFLVLLLFVSQHCFLCFGLGWEILQKAKWLTQHVPDLKPLIFEYLGAFRGNDKDSSSSIIFETLENIAMCRSTDWQIIKLLVQHQNWDANWHQIRWISKLEGTKVRPEALLTQMYQFEIARRHHRDKSKIIHFPVFEKSFRFLKILKSTFTVVFVCFTHENVISEYHRHKNFATEPRFVGSSIVYLRVIFATFLPVSYFTGRIRLGIFPEGKGRKLCKCCRW